MHRLVKKAMRDKVGTQYKVYLTTIIIKMQVWINIIILLIKTPEQLNG